MRHVLPLFIALVTGALVGAGWLRAGGLQVRAERSAGTAEQAVRSLMADVQAHNWDHAYATLDHANGIQESDFIRELVGSDGSLRTYSVLQNFDLWPLHADADRSSVRVRMNWSSAVGSLDDLRDLSVVRDGNEWRVVWPKPNFPNVPLQVLPVNYLRWDVIGRRSDDWGAGSVDSPQVRITSMNAVERPDRVLILGEVENEDTVPAYLNVNATLLKPDGTALEEQGSFDTISHRLLPKQVSPYRIDFPGLRLSQVQSVRMDVRALLVPASADPVISVENQALGKDALGRKILNGALVNQSGEVVNIAQVLAAFYDSNGRVIWVSDGYVDQALLPQAPVPFAVNVPEDVATRVQSYRVVVNHYIAPTA